MPDVELITVYVSIGNTDGKLTIQEYSGFVHHFRGEMQRVAVRVYGEWYSAPDAPYQNACMAIALFPQDVNHLRKTLTEMREGYKQDSVAWAVVPETEFI